MTNFARLLQTEAQIERADKGFECIGEHRGVLLAASRAHPGAEPHQLSQTQTARRLGKLASLTIAAFRSVSKPSGSSPKRSKSQPP